MRSGTLLIFDEVMSGFRASLSGSQELTSVRADIITSRKGDWTVDHALLGALWQAHVER